MSISLDSLSEVSNLLPNLAGDLERVEERLKIEVESNVDFLTEVTSHLISAGGKRIRPGFALMAAYLEDEASAPVSDGVISAAVAIEMVHLGSLYHDDVMDGAKKRRNILSVNAKYGNHNAILAGDFLLARASELVASLGAVASALLARTIASLCEGQILEHRFIGNTERSANDYMCAIEGKTASLLSTACEMGALASRNEVVDSGIKGDMRVGEFGLAYGMAFQIIDDISDLVGKDQGKPRGNDIMEGNYTLPVIYALEENLELKKSLDTMGGIEGEDGLSKDKCHQISVEVTETDGPKRATEKAAEYIATATDILTKFPDNPSTSAFQSGLDILTHRLKELA